MLGNILYQILMFFVIWDIYLRLGGKNTDLKQRILFLLFDIALCIWGKLIERQFGISLPLVPLVTLGFSYYLNKNAISVERFFLGFYPVVLVDIARRFLANFFFPFILHLPNAAFNKDIWWSMIPLAFVMPTVHLVDFILRIDFADILKVATDQQKKKRLSLVNMALLIYYSLIFLVTTFDAYFPELHLENTLRLPLVLGYLYLLLFVLGAVNQFAKEKIDQDLVQEQTKHLSTLERENARVEKLYKDLLRVRANYKLLLNNLREVERTGDIRASKRDLISLYVNQEPNITSERIEDFANVLNPNIYSLLTSKFHEAQMYGITIHAEVPDPIANYYLTELDLAVVLGHLMDNAIDAARQIKDGFIHIAYFEDEECQSFIIEYSMEQVTKSYGLVSLTQKESSITILQEILDRYPQTTLTTRRNGHKLMQILEMRS